MESSHLVIFSTSGKFITKSNVLGCISLSETLFWTVARGRIPITLSLRIEYLCHIIPKAQRLLIPNLPVFMFVYIHFNVPPTRIIDFVRNVGGANVSDEKIY